MQGSSFGFLVPTLSLMALPHNQCPDPLQANSSLLENVTYENTTMYVDTNGEVTDFNGLWMRRMNEVTVVRFEKVKLKTFFNDVNFKVLF